jgi:hypothetical protein
VTARMPRSSRTRLWDSSGIDISLDDPIPGRQTTRQRLRVSTGLTVEVRPSDSGRYLALPHRAQWPSGHPVLLGMVVIADRGSLFGGNNSTGLISIDLVHSHFRTSVGRVKIYAKEERWRPSAGSGTIRAQQIASR